MLRSRRQLVTSEPPLVVVRERRRSFIKLVTASASAVVLQACGGGSGSSSAAAGGSATAPITPPTTPITPPTTPTTPNPPTWSAIPTLTFVQGIASSIPIGQYLSSADARALAIGLTAGQLPAGVTFNAATKAFDYDGSGAVATADGLVLTATL